MRVLSVDDEPLALNRIADLLGQIDDIELVAELKGGTQAVEAIKNLRPDLVLLDIEMPRLSGFDVVEALAGAERDPETTPLICFVTAYPHFAIEAFETGALDFLCKPVRLQRLIKTIDRAKTALGRRESERRLGELSKQLDTLRQAHAQPVDRVLWVQNRGEMVRLPIPSLDWLEADGEYVRLHCGEASFLWRNSLTSIVEELAGDGFIRIHRSFAINGDRLRAISRKHGGVKVILESGIELPVGRRFRDQVNASLLANGAIKVT